MIHLQTVPLTAISLQNVQMAANWLRKKKEDQAIHFRKGNEKVHNTRQSKKKNPLVGNNGDPDDFGNSGDGDDSSSEDSDEEIKDKEKYDDEDENEIDDEGKNETNEEEVELLGE